MAASRTICSRCSFQLSSAGIARRSTQVARFATVADGGETSRGPNNFTRVEEPHQAHSPSFRNTAAHNVRRKPGPRRRQPADPMDLFNEVVGADEKATQPAEDFSNSDWDVAAKLNELKRLEKKPMKEQFEIFQNEIWQHIDALGRPLPRHIYLMINDFLSRASYGIVKEKLTDNNMCTNLMRMSLSVGRYDLSGSNNLVLSLCSSILKQTDQGIRSALADELINMWKYISQMRRSSQRRQKLQFALSKPEELVKHIQHLQARRVVHGDVEIDSTTKALSAIFNQFPPEHGRFLIPGLLATVSVLSKKSVVRPRRLAEAAPLFESLRIALQNGTVDNAYIDNVCCDKLGHDLSQTRAVIGKSWPKAMEMLQREDASWRRGLRKGNELTHASSNSLSYFHKQVQSAHLTDNTGAIVSIWKELLECLEQNPALGQQMAYDPEFLDFWHFIWCSAGRSEMLQETQDIMKKIGLAPSLKTYTAMMNGWKLSKDAHKIEALWGMLINSNIRLDTHAWTERISGLIELGNLQGGIHALVDMLAAWKAAVERGHPNEAVQPTVEVINAALKGLIRRDKQAALNVLDWAGKEGISPDIRTYNILLRASIRDPTANQDVQTLLKAMHAQNVEPDNATFTIILEEVLGTMAHATAAEQVEAVAQVFGDIKAAGLQPNMEIYGKTLFAVASLSNGAEEAIEEVLRHMRANGHTKISPHMALILINRYLQRGVSDSTGIHKLLVKHGFTSINTGDQRLWEHVLSAYSTTQDATRALALYDELRVAGRPPLQLFCVRDLLQALIEAEQMDAAKRVVKEVLQVQLGRRDQITSRVWKHHFWHLAYAHGLIDMESLPEDLKQTLEQGRLATSHE